MSYQIGIIGAARRHQGTGPYIARNFAQHGHKIAGIVGTSQASADQAKTALLDNYAISTEAYTSLDKLLDEHSLDIVVISSPPSTHLEYLQKALEYNCHVFCEKPLWWPQEIIKLETYLDKIELTISLANQKQRFIHINTQWPYTLKDYLNLYPNSLNNNQITQFAMYLSPQSHAETMLVDAASHGLSMLYQLVGDGTILNTQIEHNPHNVMINFDYLHKTGITQTELVFMQSNETPKPASYQINHHTVHRLVALPEYQIQLQSDRQTIAIHDPLDASIEDFLAALDAQLMTDEATLRLGALHLYQLIEEFSKS